MFAERLRALGARLPRTRRTDLKVAAYCHCFGVGPDAATDGGERADDR